MKVKIRDLKDLTAKSLKGYGYNEEEISIISDVLLYAQLRGNNQGVVKLIGAGIPKNPQAGKITVEKETPISARINGKGNHAMIVVRKALDIVMEKAKKNGFGIVGTHNTNTSSGAIGYFASEIAKQGMIGFVFGRSTERVAVHGSCEPVFGTNPLSIGIPADPDPLVLDMSTAAISFYGLVEAATAGRSVPRDAAYDSEGKETTNPKDAMKGAIRSFDRSYKGSGLAMMGEILAGPLVGAAFAGIGDSKGNWGHLLYAVDPEILVDRKDFVKNVTKLIQKVKSTKRLEGVTEIFVPGERGTMLMRQWMKTGEIEIEDNLLKELRAVADKS